MRFKAALVGLVLAQAFVGASLAEDKKPAPVGSQPETTTATYGAWTLQCERRADVANGQKICEIAESVVPKDQQNPIARIGIGHPLGAAKGELRITAILPPNIYIPVVPTIKAKDGDPGLTLVWQRCFAGGCFAEATLTPGQIKIWRSMEADTGRLAFTEAVGRKLAIQFSLRGFAQALDAFDKVKS